LQREHNVTTRDADILQHSDLNAFLFADVGVEANGMVLSVLSTLARRGVDPWQEAGYLAKLPRAVAIEGLARIIAAMPASPWSLQDATATAEPLVRLLPERSPTDPFPTPETKAKPRTARRWGIAVVLLGAMLAGLVPYCTGPSNPSAPAVEARDGGR
jgi:hypothetical protein